MPATEPSSVTIRPSDLGRAVTAALNKKIFLRRRLDDQGAERVVRAFQACIEQHDPLDCLMLWGVGGKRDVGLAEMAAVRHLESIDRAARRIWPVGILFRIIVSDVHARMNGFSEATTADYCRNVESFLERQSRIFVYLDRLSRYWQKEGIDLTAVLAESGRYSWFTREPVYDFFLNNARRVYQGDDPEQGVLRYFAVRRADRKILAASHPGAVFLTYNDPRIDPLIRPDLPALHPWALRKGDCRAPWFTRDEDVKCAE